MKKARFLGLVSTSSKAAYRDPAYFPTVPVQSIWTAIQPSHPCHDSRPILSPTHLRPLCLFEAFGRHSNPKNEHQYVMPSHPSPDSRLILSPTRSRPLCLVEASGRQAHGGAHGQGVGGAEQRLGGKEDLEGQQR